MGIGSRYIDGDKLEEILERREPSGLLIPARGAAVIRRWIKRQPKAPALVSRQGAAEILGISSPHIARIADRLTPVTVEGSSRPVYLLAEIKALKKVLDAEKKTKD